MSFFAASPFLKALGWALVNSLWQFAACWLMYSICIAGINKLSAAVKHMTALLLLFAGTISFLCGLSWKYYFNIVAAADGASPAAPTTIYNVWHSAGTAVDSLMPYGSALYLVCVIFLLFKFFLLVQRAGRLQKSGHSKMNAEWRMYVKNICAQLGIQKEVKALLSVHIDTPQVIGFLKPVILLPAACLVNLSTEQLEAVLLHELVHIKRNDYVVNLFVTSVEILFFFNPFVKQITSSIRKEREYSCDDMVMQFQYHPHNYAAALLTLEKNRMMPVTYGIAASGKNQQQLLTRIERIMGIRNKQKSAYQLGACLMAILLLGMVATINPAKVAVDKFGTDGLLLADNTLSGQQFTDEPAGRLINIAIPQPAKEINPKKLANILVLPAAKQQPAHGGTSHAAIQAEDLLSYDGDEDSGNNFQLAGNQEAFDYSMTQKEGVVSPTPESPAEPYVPASSFSFQLLQDTAMPKIKGETYNERMAKDALLKAQKAIEQIDWQKIEKQLKYSRRDIVKLKNELVGQIKKLNWQKINSDVKTSLSQEKTEQVLDALHQEQSLKTYRQYQQAEALQESLNKLSAEQSLLLKENEQRTLEAQKETEKQLKKMQQDLKKRRIIYI